MAEFSNRQKDIFLKALDLSAPDERAAYLDHACGDNASLRRQVDAMLQAHATSDSFLEKPAAAMGPTVDDLPRASSEPGCGESPGTRVGPYKLLQQVGQGGMGTVWMAEQMEPVRRKVAIKLIKPGMDSAQVIARFEAERQALALMDHPNIARVLDAGTTSEGRPYFVMELVKGIAITKYCDDNQLTPRERLALMIPVCQAVQHAHQKGLIHRDLKPSNVLIASYDGKPVPKVIDFGVAKAMGQQLTERTLFTGFGSIVGTLEYMSPEQAEFNALDVDTRSDIYSLGVLVYELLTGSTPLSRKRLNEAAMAEVLRLIREEEPPRPSMRLSESKHNLASLSAQRKLEPAQLAREVRGELDWIVMKALEKDRNRRYETANSLARDFERYLADEPVEACPPSARYRLTKFARRYKKALATVGAFVMLLVTGAAACAWQAIEARRAEAEARRAEAETRTVLDFFRNKVLSATRPKGFDGGLGSDVSLRAALDAAEPEIAAAFAGHPEAEAEIRYTLGLNYSLLEERARAIRQFEQALALCRKARGEEDYRTLASMSNLAIELSGAGRGKEALPLAEEAFNGAKINPGPDDLVLLHAMSVLATVYQRDRRFSEAISLFEDELQRRRTRFGSDEPGTLMTLNNLAWAYYEAGRRAEVVPLYETALKGMKTKLGPNHPSTLLITFNLAWAYDEMGRLPEALPLYEESLKGSEIVLGQDHPVMENRQVRVTQAFARAERWTESAVLYLKQVDGLRRKLPAEHPNLTHVLGSLGICRLKAGDAAAAETPLREALRIQEKWFPDDWRRFNGMAYLGESLLGQKKYAEAEPLLVAGCEGMKQREAKIEAEFKVRLTEPLERLLQLYGATGDKAKAAECRKKLDDAREANKKPPA